MGGAWPLFKNVLILEPIVYGLFGKEDKTGKILKLVICTIMHGSYSI